ncbi:STAS domain-containing protein [Saccharomonospora cyanea]|uniref:Anti-sigma factor antagonist n=1 Tax=Saccharomonospora cyanea NA-134 TaxID=882082 RepID=H5XRD7_9PSEU|nr:STAS domain-containing protein [Saccharomonospora cyanea]EHR63419.1 anti-anti-sigma factor [Saccharomonospora cyanea NA-134]
MTTADVEVRSQEDTVEILLTGEIDLSNSDAVKEKIFGSIDNRLVAVTIDLGGLSYIDSAGLRILFALAERLRLLQTACTVIAPVGTPTRRVLEMSGMTAVAQVKP